MTTKRKKELLGILQQIGMNITRLEGECYAEQLALRRIQNLRTALDAVRFEIAGTPERQEGQ
jgi:hypothetical protein